MPHGVSAKRLIDVISQVDNVVGAALTEHAPSGGVGKPGEAEVIRQLGTALRL